MKQALISVILATYNRPDALNLVLHSLLGQTDGCFEIVIADDGSSIDTANLIQTFLANGSVHIKHVWQEDDGFRKAKILNVAIHAAAGEYLVFLDGDCVVQPDFIAQHRQLARAECMVTGSRILIEKEWAQQLCAQQTWSFTAFLKHAVNARLTGQINKVLPLFVKLPWFPLRVYRAFEWRRIKGCNMACWKKDALAIEGFDEELVGWGHEDADFVFRLSEIGITRISGAWATEVLHLWHKTADKSQALKNAEIVRSKIMAKSKNQQLHNDR